jgi:hypothetical protein
MPFRSLFSRQTWEYAIIEAETRPLELVLSMFSGVTGAWLILAPRDAAPPSFWDGIDSHWGMGFWAWWSLFNAVFQWVSVWYRYPQLRRWSACSASIYWVWIAVIIGAVNWRLLAFSYAVVFAFAELLIVVRRAAIAEGNKECAATTED